MLLRLLRACNKTPIVMCMQPSDGKFPTRHDCRKISSRVTPGRIIEKPPGGSSPGTLPPTSLVNKSNSVPVSSGDEGSPVERMRTLMFRPTLPQNLQARSPY